MTASTAPINYAPPSLNATKFIKQAGETVQFKGDLNWTIGEAGIKNLFTGKYKVTECTAFLTNQRFVATPLRKYFPFGPLIWLIRAFFARKIVFSVPLNEIAAIKLDPAQKSTLILQTTFGQEFTLVSTSLFNSIPKWIPALTSAVTQSVAGTTSRQSDTGIAFSRG
jgi:hypothetical protein